MTTTFNISVIYVTDQKKIQRRNTPVNQQQMVRKIKASVWRVRGPGFWSSSTTYLACSYKQGTNSLGFNSLWKRGNCHATLLLTKRIKNRCESSKEKQHDSEWLLLSDRYKATTKKRAYSVKLSNKILIWIYRRNLFLEKHILNIIQTIKNKSIVMWYLG